MVKKRLLIISCLTAMLSLTSVNVNADPVGIILQGRGYIDPNEDVTNDGEYKSPILVPKIGLEDYTIIFDTPLRRLYPSFGR